MVAAAVVETGSERLRADVGVTLDEGEAVTEALRNDRTELRPAVRVTEAHLLTPAAVADIGTEAPVEVAAAA